MSYVAHGGEDALRKLRKSEYAKWTLLPDPVKAVMGNATLSQLNPPDHFMLGKIEAFIRLEIRL